MTTEDDFQNSLDANPDDWQTRLVFADWLEEHDDPRAEGYRALGLLRRVPVNPGSGPAGNRWLHTAFCAKGTRESCDDCRKAEMDAARIPDDWFKAYEPAEQCPLEVFTLWLTAPAGTRRAVEDAAAIAFAKLPAARRAELLKGEA